MISPPSKLPSKLKVAAPRHMAKKNSFRSAPRMVSGRESERCTGFVRLWYVMASSLCRRASGKQPGEKIDGGDGHTDAEENASEDTFRAAFSKSEREPGHDDRDER